ncbi:MAG: cytochrome c oxidase assembly protein [Acidimicrobiia bacterium]|nr:cytochrome c oxidase assembly protein [Acidimicrobiia bacterium]
MIPAWHPHFDVWAVVFVLGLGYWYANTRIRLLAARSMPGPTRRQWFQWYLGLALILAVSDWPLHDVGEQSLFTVHMIEHMVLGLAVPPLLLMGTPRWLADATLGHPKVAAWLRPMSRAVPAFVAFNTTFILIHWPEMVSLMLTNSVAHFTIHYLLFVSAGLMWMPVLSPTPAIPKLRRPAQMLYLFLQSLLPTIPASFLTFSSAPIYPIYGDAALAWGLTAVADQTIAGIVMKLGGGLLIWATIAVIWFRWSNEERGWERLDPLSVG